MREHGKTAERVRTTLLEDIRSGFFPPGAHLTGESLAARYSVSRMPVREALIRLGQEGVLSGSANAGFEVRQPTIRELCEIYEIRELLEGLAIERIVRDGHNEAFLNDLRQYCEMRRTDGKTSEHDSSDLAFHQTICRYCPSGAVREIVDRHLILSTVFAVAPKLFHANYEKTTREHEAILAAAEADDGKRARKLLAAHIASARKRLERLLN